MGGQFETFGPFALKTASGAVLMDAVDEMFLEADLVKDGLSRAIGVYVVAKNIGKGALLPLYVGKTEAGFSKRFRAHVRGKKGFTKLDDAGENGTLAVFLIGLVSLSDRFRGPVKGKNEVIAVRYLEVMMIGACLRLNRNLLNTSLKTLYRSLRVPGYLDGQNPERNQSAKRFAAMLAVEKQEN
jgi:hypothetical protein